MLHNVRDTFPSVFSGGGRTKPHSKGYRDFKERWGFIGTIYEIAEEKVEKVKEINQMYLSDFFLFLTYLIQKGEMEDEEDAFQETLRKAKRGR